MRTNASNINSTRLRLPQVQRKWFSVWCYLGKCDSIFCVFLAHKCLPELWSANDKYKWKANAAIRWTMATQKPGEWANSLLGRFEEQVRKNWFSTALIWKCIPKKGSSTIDILCKKMTVRCEEEWRGNDVGSASRSVGTRERILFLLWMRVTVSFRLRRKYEWIALYAHTVEFSVLIVKKTTEKVCCASEVYTCYVYTVLLALLAGMLSFNVSWVGQSVGVLFMMSNDDLVFVFFKSNFFRFAG